MLKFKLPKIGIRTISVLMAVMLLVSSLAASMAFAAATSATVNVSGTYDVICTLKVIDVNGQSLSRIETATLAITDDTVSTKGIISTSTLTITGYAAISLTGFVGMGSRPQINLSGSGTDAVVSIVGRIQSSENVATGITGQITGTLEHSQGTLGAAGGGATATWDVAKQYNGAVSAKLVQNGVEGSTYVQFVPKRGFYIKDLDTITAGFSVAHFLESEAGGWGPQIELKFQKKGTATPDGIAHVDVTLIPYQQDGTDAWVVTSMTSAATNCLYYGNDDVDGTAFDGPSGLLSAVEAAINAEGVLNGASTSKWELTRVRVEIWEAVARDCWIDEVTINGTTYSFEPASVSGSFRATVQ